ncbi:MAG TPA: peptide deformylase [Candidatus Paceibacterota bacterium]
MKDPVVQVGDPVLRAIAKPVAKKDIGTPALTKTLKHMSQVLAKEEYGVALAAPQIGESLRIFVISGRVFKEEGDEEDTTPTPPDKVFINPTITNLSRKKREMSEGCLSVRGKYGTVMRHEKASVRAWDEAGKLFTYNGSGLVAHIFQHECDHLDGTLYIDKAVKLEDDEKRDELREKHPA